MASLETDLDRPRRHEGQRAAATATNYSQELFQTISEYLTPDHPAKFP